MYYKRLMKDYELRKSGLKRTRENIIQYYVNVIEEKTDFELDEIEKDFENTHIYFTNEKSKGVVCVYVNSDMIIEDFDIFGEVDTDLDFEKIKELIER